MCEQIIRIGSNSPGGVSFHPIFARSPGVVNALLALRKGEIETSTIALQWLKAQPGLSAKDLHQVGVTYRIKSAEDAIRVLTALTKLATYKTSPNSRLVILMDEYQRIGELRTSVRNEINAGLHTYYNANATGLTIMLSFSFGNKDNVSFLLSRELISRAEPESISLDVLTPGQAIEFLSDLLAQFRIRLDDQWAYPFSPQAVHTIVQYIAQRKTLTPRRVMLYANHILTEHLVNSPEAEGEVSEAEIWQYLKALQLGEMDIDNDNSIGES
jgi:hypothetical protein